MPSVFLLIFIYILSSFNLQSAVVHINPYGVEGYTTSLNTTTNYGTHFLKLIYDDETEFNLNFAPNKLSIRRNIHPNVSSIISHVGAVHRFEDGTEIFEEGLWPSYAEFKTYWTPGVEGYVGFLLSNDHLMYSDKNISTSYNYGWLRMRWNEDTTVTIYDWAYESQANTPIRAGVIPEVNSIVILLFSIMVICFFRKRF